MICLAGWANTQKAAGKWRFELYYIDFGLGMLLLAVALALTFGSLGSDLSVEDNLAIAGKRNMAYAMVAGAAFSLSNMLLAAAVSVAGMSVAFPIAFAVTMIFGAFLNFIFKVPANIPYAVVGMLFLLGSITTMAFAHAGHLEEMRKNLTPAARRRRDSAAKGILLSCISGFFMTLFIPLVDMSKASEIGLGPYTVGIFMALGAFLIIFPLNLYFMNLPVSGESINFLLYTKGTMNQHFLGFLGGLMASAGMIGVLVAYSAPKQALSLTWAYALTHAVPLLSIACGMLVWKEFSSATGKTPLFLGLGGLLFAAGLGCLAIA